MPIVPAPRVQKLEFFETRLTPWTANQAAIGLLAGDVTQMGTLNAAARAKYQAHLEAQAAAKAATAEFYSAVSAMAAFGSDLIIKIKSKAQNSADPDAVYAQAQIPGPATPAPVAAPGTASNFKVTLRQDGAVILNWKCANPSNSQGTTYDVRRKIGAGGAFQHIGATGIREFTDPTVPAGSAQVTYEITAFRSTRRGNPANFTVNFGVDGGGEMTASIAAVPKLAA